MPVVRTSNRSNGTAADPDSPITCDLCAVRNRSICATLTREEIVQLNSISQFKTIPFGQQVLRDGEAQEHFATVVEGVIKLTKSLGDGRQQIVGLQFPSDFLGRPWRRESPYDATAVTELTLCQFSRTRFEALTVAHPALAHRLLAHTLDELDAAQEWLLLLGRKTANEKVASMLAMMSRRMVERDEAGASVGGAVAFDLPLTRGEMADFLGVTIETVSRQLTRFKVAGYIDLRAGRAITVRDLAALERAGGAG